MELFFPFISLMRKYIFINTGREPIIYLCNVTKISKQIWNLHEKIFLSFFSLSKYLTVIELYGQNYAEMRVWPMFEPKMLQGLKPWSNLLTHIENQLTIYECSIWRIFFSLIFVFYIWPRFNPGPSGQKIRFSKLSVWGYFPK